MKSQTRTCSLLLCSLFLLTACASTKVVDKSSGSRVKTISTYAGSGTVAPIYRISTTMKLGRDLNLNKVVKDYRGTTTVNKNVKITQGQFDRVVKEVEAADISKLKSTEHPPSVGGGSRSLSIVTDNGTYHFNENYRTDYPRVIARLFSNVEQLMPN